MRNDASLTGFEEFMREGGASDRPDIVDPVSEFFWKTDYDCGVSRLETIYKQRAAETQATARTRNSTLAKAASAETAAPDGDETPTLEKVGAFESHFSLVKATVLRMMKDGTWPEFSRKAVEANPGLVAEWKAAISV
jgi:hypothetical protein